MIGSRAGFLLAALLVCTSAWTASPDYAREKRWADEITPAIVVGDPITLATTRGHRFLAIYESPASSKAGVIVVHGAGVHPDWGLIGTLRTRLAEHGYATLSVQMPVLSAQTKPEEYAPTFPEAVERLRQAVQFLRSKGHKRLAIVSHSTGARMANEFLVADPAHGIAAWASLGINGGELVDAERLRVPVLDLFGERDSSAIRGNAGKRAAVLAKLPRSAQIEVTGADHLFSGREDEMVRWVRGFLDKALAP